MQQPFLVTGSGITEVTLRNSAGHKTGNIVEWVMDAERGKVLYVIVRKKNFDKLKCLPWPALKVDSRNGGYKVENESDLDDALEISETEIARITGRKELVSEVYEKMGYDDAIPGPYAEVHQESTEDSPEDVEQKGYGGREHPEKLTSK